MFEQSLLTRIKQGVTDYAARRGLERLAQTVADQGGQPLDLVLPDGSRVSFGLAPEVILTIRDPAALASFAAPTLDQLGTAFVEGRIDLDGDLRAAMQVAEALVGAASADRPVLAASEHEASQDRNDISHHYDVGNAFYRLWLDRQMVYSCAYFRQGDEDIDQAQRAKLDHVCRKLRLRPGERLLDIGCGWGGLVLHAAQHYGVQAVGITLSRSQFELGQERIAQAGLAGSAQLLLLDYREIGERFGPEAFDKVASIGMFEHVGLKRLPEYFGAVRDCLKERGLFLNHGITSSDVENRPVGAGAGEFIGRYVFPHGELPHVHLAVREMSAQGFEVCDVESLRPHYARTLALWSQRLEARREEARALVSEKILRIWRVYLAGCSHGFAQGWVNIYQLLASRQTRPGPTALPLTRDWIYAPR